MDGSKIIHVPRRFAQEKWGGTESVILNLCRQQQKRGLSPEIHTSKALSRFEREEWNGLPIRRYGYMYPYFPLSKRDREAYDLKGGNLVSWSLYRALLREKDVRVFHAHALKRLGGEVLTAAKKLGKPCVVTIHGNCFDVPDSEQASLNGDDEGPHFEWGKILGMYFGSRRLLDEAHAVVCVGHSEFEAASEKLGHDRVYYLPNGVNLEPFARGNRETCRTKLGFKETDIVFGCVSRVDPQKGQHLMLEALERLLPAHPKAAVVIAGPVTDPEYGKSLATRAEALGDRVRLLPAVEPESEKHASLLAAFDTFVLPSRHEPFGIVVLEAWASRKPVIASEVGGLVRLIDEGRDALHFESGNADELAAAMKRLIDEPRVGSALAGYGYEKVTEKYTWDRIYDRMEQIYAAAAAACPLRA